MRMIVRMGDTSSHGGSVVNGASKSMAENRKIARVGDILNCPLHGPQPIAEGSPNSPAEGKPIARNGDKAACGAALIASATKTAVN